MRHIFTLIGNLVKLCIAAVLAVFFSIIFMVTFFTAWVTGTPISVKNGGRVVGYVRWFKFHRK